MSRTSTIIMQFRSLLAPLQLKSHLGSRPNLEILETQRNPSSHSPSPASKWEMLDAEPKAEPKVRRILGQGLLERKSHEFCPWQGRRRNISGVNQGKQNDSSLLLNLQESTMPVGSGDHLSSDLLFLFLRHTPTLVVGSNSCHLNHLNFLRMPFKARSSKFRTAKP